MLSLVKGFGCQNDDVAVLGAELVWQESLEFVLLNYKEPIFSLCPLIDLSQQPTLVAL